LTAKKAELDAELRISEYEQTIEKLRAETRTANKGTLEAERFLNELQDKGKILSKEIELITIEIAELAKKAGADPEKIDRLSDESLSKLEEKIYGDKGNNYSEVVIDDIGGSCM